MAPTVQRYDLRILGVVYPHYEIFDGEQYLGAAESEAFARLCAAAPQLAEVVSDLLQAVEIANTAAVAGCGRGVVEITAGGPWHRRLEAALGAARPQP